VLVREAERLPVREHCWLGSWGARRVACQGR
jgi:hypothetical protein